MPLIVWRTVPTCTEPYEALQRSPASCRSSLEQPCSPFSRRKTQCLCPPQLRNSGARLCWLLMAYTRPCVSSCLKAANPAALAIPFIVRWSMRLPARSSIKSTACMSGSTPMAMLFIIRPEAAKGSIWLLSARKVLGLRKHLPMPARFLVKSWHYLIPGCNGRPFVSRRWRASPTIGYFSWGTQHTPLFPTLPKAQRWQ